MPDLGEPASYLVLKKGAPVYSSDGEKVGEVEHVLADPEIDIFDGVVLDTSVLPGGHRFVDADQIGQIYERGVVLKADRAGAESLPEPAANPAAMEADPTDEPDSKLEQRLHRAWEMLSGKEPKD
ncbi:MAG: PRC-barrel domain-containing protein [Solirubrobacterales bacterium]